MCWSCFCCPVCTALGTGCSLPLATCCDRRGFKFLDHPATLWMSGLAFVLGLILHAVLTTRCSNESGRPWNPLPTAYQNTSCFASNGNNSNFNLGFWSVIFLGVGAPWFAAATWARLTRERRAETWRAEDAHYLELGIPNPHLGMPTYAVPTFPAFVHVYPTMATPAPSHATFVRVDEASAPVYPQGTVQAPQPDEGKPAAR